jgi:hypothetical protein
MVSVKGRPNKIFTLKDPRRFCTLSYFFVASYQAQFKIRGYIYNFLQTPHITYKVTLHMMGSPDSPILLMAWCQNCETRLESLYSPAVYRKFLVSFIAHTQESHIIYNGDLKLPSDIAQSPDSAIDHNRASYW